MKTNNKLIKISELHYIIVNDSEIKVGDWYTWDGNKNVAPSLCTDSYNESSILDAQGFTKFFKVTHSTQPLEPSFKSDKDDRKDFIFIKPLSLSDCQEIDFGYSVEKMVKNLFGYDKNVPLPTNDIEVNNWIEGFNAHKGLVKDKLFTIEDIRKALWCLGDVLFNNNQNGIEEGEPEKYFNDIIQSLLPPTEWDVTFDEQGKLKLM